MIHLYLLFMYSIWNRLRIKSDWPYRPTYQWTYTDISIKCEHFSLFFVKTTSHVPFRTNFSRDIYFKMGYYIMECLWCYPDTIVYDMWLSFTQYFNVHFYYTVLVSISRLREHKDFGITNAVRACISDMTSLCGLRELGKKMRVQHENDILEYKLDHWNCWKKKKIHQHPSNILQVN